MERITMSIDEKLAKEFDALIAKRGYTSRSEAMRDLLRREVESNRSAYEAKSHCVANLSYIYNHHERELAERLTETQHEHHDLVVSAMHVHLDHDHCLEVIVMRGRSDEIRNAADRLISTRGVVQGDVALIAEDTLRGMGPRRREHAPEHAHPHPHEERPARAKRGSTRG